MWSASVDRRSLVSGGMNRRRPWRAGDSPPMLTWNLFCSPGSCLLCPCSSSHAYWDRVCSPCVGCSSLGYRVTKDGRRPESSSSSPAGSSSSGLAVLSLLWRTAARALAGTRPSVPVRWPAHVDGRSGAFSPIRRLLTSTIACCSPFPRLLPHLVVACCSTTPPPSKSGTRRGHGRAFVRRAPSSLARPRLRTPLASVPSPRAHGRKLIFRSLPTKTARLESSCAQRTELAGDPLAK